MIARRRDGRYVAIGSADGAGEPVGMEAGGAQHHAATFPRDSPVRVDTAIDGPVSGRPELEAAWLRLTRHELPALADGRGWPVRADHCFQRILLDNAVGGLWYDAISGRPAYRHADAAVLADAVALGRAAIAGQADLHALNARSLAWRRKAKARA